MSSPPLPSQQASHNRNFSSASSLENHGHGNQQPTVAAFSPSSALHSPSATGKQRSTILLHKKSPLLVATPPQITRALAYSHPFLLPLNKFFGLLSWTTGDPWESFLMVAAFWAITLYGDIITRWAGPLVVVMGLIIGMYARRYSPLSSTGATGEKRKNGHKRGESESSIALHKSLDDIVETLRLFTSRCNILLDPFLSLTDFLSTQTTATTATTRPALTTLFIRILLVTPLWIFLTLPPLRIITTKRVILAVGTTILTWHSQPTRVTRTIFWRSRTVRMICSMLTGLNLMGQDDSAHRGSSGKSGSPHDIAASLAAKRRPASPGIRFTFTIYENQRRWLGIGWTASMLAYERAAWTDEHLNTTAPKDKFDLPEVEGGHSRWRWVDGSEWHIDGSEKQKTEGSSDQKDGSNSDGDGGWIYYDNKWRDGRRGKDGWGRYTRRRMWCRDAELVEVAGSDEESTHLEAATGPSDNASTTTTLVDKSAMMEDGSHNKNPSKDDAADLDKDAYADSQSVDVALSTTGKDADTDSSGALTARRRKRWFARRDSQPSSEHSVAVSSGSIRLDDDHEDVHVPLSHRDSERDSNWGVGDEALMQLG